MPGHAAIDIGVKEFMCVGANPPFDHPHVFLDMGSDDEKVCPYCSTLYRYDARAEGERNASRRLPLPRPRRLISSGPDRAMKQPDKIVIAGAGIAGLTAALAFAASGFDVRSSSGPKSSTKSARGCSFRPTRPACSTGSACSTC